MDSRIKKSLSFEHMEKWNVSDEALVAKVIRGCPSRIAKESPECRLPGWFPVPPAPSHLWLEATRMILSVHKMSGQKCAELSIKCAELPDIDLRRQIFNAMAANDPAFPGHVCWFLPQIMFTPIEVENQSSAPTGTCTIVFPALDVNDNAIGWNKFSVNGCNGAYVMPDDKKIIVGGWSDADTLLVGFYLASSQEQHASLARIIAKSGVSDMAEPAYLSAAETIFTSPRFTAVNQLKETYKGVEYDTTLWHLLLAKFKRWNYPGLSKLFLCLLSRDDLDLSQIGWSWTSGGTISAAELCFIEWCAIAEKDPKRQLWVDSTTPRLCLLSACLHVQKKCSGAAAQMFHQLQAFMDKKRRTGKRKGLLRKFMLRDLELLASEELLTLPCFLTLEDLSELIVLLERSLNDA